MHALSACLPRIGEPALRKRGFAQGELITRWTEIAGAEIAAAAVPQRIAARRDEAGGTLHLRCAGAFAPTLQHLAPVLIERINAFFGYAAVTRIAIAHGRVAPPAGLRRRPAPAVAPETEAALAEKVAAIDDPGLREALMALGRAVAARGRGPRID
ncbi:MAG: DUF721 domain-containing protein [Rhodospirillales bacterium]